MPEQQLRLKPLSVEDLEFQPDNPRLSMYDEDLDSLGKSIQRDGLVEPIIVRPHGQKYEVVAGERRVRAAIRSNVATLPAIIREGLTDQEASRLRLIENIERTDLSVIEKAIGIKEHMRKFNFTLKAVAQEVGIALTTAQQWVRDEEQLSPTLKTGTPFLRRLSPQKLHRLSKYTFETQEKLAKVIINGDLLDSEANRFMDMFDANPDGNLTIYAEKAREQMKTVKVTLPIAEAKSVQKRAREIQKQEKKASKKLDRHLQKPPRGWHDRPSQPVTVEVPYETPDVKASRQLELGKIAAAQSLSQVEIARLQQLMEQNPDESASELAKQVRMQARVQVIILELAPKLYSSLESYANKEHISIKDAAIVLLKEGLGRHGFWSEGTGR